MNNIFKFLKDEFLIITISVYGIGLLYLYVFYNYFNIPIYYYIEIKDLLITPLQIIFIIFLYVIIFEKLFYQILGDFIRKIGAKLFKNDSLSKEDAYFKLNVLHVGITNLICLLLMQYNGSLFLILLLYLAPVICLWEGVYKETKDIQLLKEPHLAIGMYSVLLMFIFHYNASKYVEKEKLMISFKYESRYYETSKKSSYYYLGETSSVIFLFESKNKRTDVFNKSDLKELRYY